MRDDVVFPAQTKGKLGATPGCGAIQASAPTITESTQLYKGSNFTTPNSTTTWTWIANQPTNQPTDSQPTKLATASSLYSRRRLPTAHLRLPAVFFPTCGSWGQDDCESNTAERPNEYCLTGCCSMMNCGGSQPPKFLSRVSNPETRSKDPRDSTHSTRIDS